MKATIKYCPHCRSELAANIVGEQQRLSCLEPGCDFVHWNNPTPVVAAIIVYQGQVMLVHHVNWPPKMLALVSGFLEAGEHPDQAVVREIKEETGLDTEALNFVGHYAFVEQNQLLMVYQANCSGTVQLNEELDRYKLLPEEKVIPWPIGTGPAVKDWLQRNE